MDDNGALAKATCPNEADAAAVRKKRLDKNLVMEKLMQIVVCLTRPEVSKNWAFYGIEMANLKRILRARTIDGDFYLVGARMLKAMFIMLIAMSAIPAGDAASKILTSELGVAPTYVVWTRFLIGGLVILPFTCRAGLSVWRDWRVWFRALLIALGISCITRALQLAPLADVFGAFFIGPLVSFVLSVWLLKEKARAVQVFLVLLGFVGVLMIVRPGFVVTAGLGWALLAGTLYGAFLTASRWLAGSVALGGLMITQMVGSVVLVTPFVFGQFPEFTPQIAKLTVISALGSMVGNVLMLFAYKMQEASKLAPFVYFQLISAVVLGWLIFGEWPDVFVVLGMSVVIFAGCASALLQSRRPVAART